MELTTVGVPAANALRGKIDRTAVAPANAAVRRIKVRRWIDVPEIFLFGGFMFVRGSRAATSAPRGRCLTGRRFKSKRKIIQFAGGTQSFRTIILPIIRQCSISTDSCENFRESRDPDFPGVPARQPDDTLTWNKTP